MKSKISPVVDKDLETVEPITTSTFREELNWDFMRSETLFGRSREIEQMSNVVRRRFKPCSRPELLLVSGYAGAGKTALVAQLRKIFEAQDVYFVSGKFDQMKRPEPYSTLMKTLTIFVAKILKSDEATIMKAEADILRAVQGEIGLLIRMIPNLKKLVGHHEYFELQGADVLDQLKNTFRKFISAACSSSRRLVFVMDDLQWADIGSLELLEAIVSDKKNHSIALVGICRTEEVSLSHDLAVILRKLEDEMETGIVNVDVGYLSMHSAVQLVSSVLHQPEGKCQFVTTTLHQKTKGNPLFLILLLKALYDKEVLVPDKESAQWLWDNDKWKLHFKNIENVVDLMLQRIEDLPQYCERLLSICACLGTEVNEFLLSKLKNSFSLNVKLGLERCFLQGVLVQDLQSSRFRFFHDRTQQASYQLVPEYKRPGLHLSLGRALLKELSKIELDEHIFLVVDQMSRGLSNDVMDTVEEIKFASLCLKAGEKAASSSDYQTSLKYLKQGRSILDERRDWRDQYDLMLGLHQCIAQSSCCTGDFTAVDETVNLIKKYGRSFDDMIPSYMIHIHAMSARMMFADALDVGLEVLDQLEGGIPKNPKRLHIIASLFNVKWLLYGLSDERLMALPSMLDKKKTQEMVILNLLLNPAYFIRRDLFPCLILRMMKLSLTHALGFTMYGLLQVSLDDIDAGWRFFNMGLGLLHGRFSSVKSQWIPRVYAVYYSCIGVWKTPLRTLLRPLSELLSAGIEGSDRDAFFIISYLRYVVGFSSGEQFATIEPLLRVAVLEMKAHNQVVSAEYLNLIHETMLLLMGRNDDPIIQNGIVMSSLEKWSKKLNDIEAIAGNEGDGYASSLANARMIVFYHLGDIDKAFENAKKCWDHTFLFRSAVGPLNVAFYECLTYLTYCRQTHKVSRWSRKKVMKKAQKPLQYLKKRERHCPQNVQHRVFLLEAEIDAIEGDVDAALTKYEVAGELASQESYFYVQALACERAAVTLQELRLDEQRKFELLNESIEAYKKWGAAAKVQQLKLFLDDLKSTKWTDEEDAI